MRWIWRTLLVLVIPAAICILIPLLLSFLFQNGLIEYAQFFPEDGIWYCEELQIQAAFGETGETFIVVEGEKIDCVWENDPGSEWLNIISQDRDTKVFKLGESVFSGTYVRLDETRLVLRDPDSGQEYTFVKISEVGKGLDLSC